MLLSWCHMQRWLLQWTATSQSWVAMTSPGSIIFNVICFLPLDITTFSHTEFHLLVYYPVINSQKILLQFFIRCLHPYSPLNFISSANHNMLTRNCDFVNKSSHLWSYRGFEEEIMRLWGYWGFVYRLRIYGDVEKHRSQQTPLLKL